MKKIILSAIGGAILAVLAILIFNTSGEKPVLIEDDFFSEIAAQNTALDAENRALMDKARVLERQLKASTEATTAAERRAAEAKKKVIIRASPADFRDDLIASLEKVIVDQKNQLFTSLELNHVYTMKIANLERMFDNTQVALDLRTQQFGESLEKNKKLTKKVKFYRTVATITLGGLVVSVVLFLLRK